MVLTLVGSSLSVCTKRVMIVLYEKQVPFKHVEIDFSKGEHLTPAYLEKQPFGKVPYIDDDGYILYESRAICRYIEEKYADQGTQGLIPTEPKARGLFEQAVSVEVSNFDPFASKAGYEMLIKPHHEGKPSDPQVFTSLIATLEKNLDVYEKILSKQAYLAGESITLADLFHIPSASLLPTAGSNAMQTRPNVARWIKALADRPSWKTVLKGLPSRG
ncbi:glutathione S-transferase [Ephemerocybe angulata]|uniref:glutathione transferase n=1 Tax=Ephemerocybe angulata TaxID=980116 RepID=A0A8H6HII8_9AGAR|nr:glutathione S-transferase [Tulosesus angulatus]